MLYNPDDFASVAAGRMHPAEPQPYLVFDLEAFSHVSNRGNGDAGAIAFDEASGRLFYMEHNGDPNYEYGYALIHV